MPDLLINIAVIATLIIIHECGHYLAGRLIGIPGNHVKIQLLTYPPHVALGSGINEWISPSEPDRFIDRLTAFSDDERKHYLFVAGGHALEFLFVMALVAITLLSGNALLMQLAEPFIIFSLMLSAIYLLIDFYHTSKYQQPGGDFSGQWMISKGWTLLFYLVYFGVLVLMLMLIR